MFQQINRQSLFPILMIFAGVALIMGAVFWMVSGIKTPVTSSPSAPAQASKQASSVDAPPEEGVRRVTLADAKAAYDLGAAVFVDVRGEPYYSQGHITGALPIDEDELEERLGELDPTAWIITYCT